MDDSQMDNKGSKNPEMENELVNRPDVSKPDELNESVESNNISLEVIANKLDEMANLIEGIGEDFSGFTNSIDEKILSREHDKKIIDKLHVELQHYKSDIYSNFVIPIIRDVIRMRDNIILLSKAHIKEQAVSLSDFNTFSDEAREILERYGVEVSSGTEGMPFNPSRQKIAKKVITDKENMHGKVISSLSSGYIYNGKIISYENVEAYIYQPSSCEENIKNNEGVL